MGRRLVDELGDEDDGREDGGHKADAADDDVEVGQGHGHQGEEQQEQRQDEDAYPDHQVQGHHAHVKALLRWRKLQINLVTYVISVVILPSHFLY